MQGPLLFAPVLGDHELLPAPVGAPVPFCLLGKDAGTTIGPAGGDVRRYRRHWSPIHPDFAVDDLDAAAARAVAAGAMREGRPARPPMAGWRCSPTRSATASVS
jgi:hypothetical protein